MPTQQTALKKQSPLKIFGITLPFQWCDTATS
jgi:hypothetical protein